MAVFTHLTLDEAKAFLTQYDLGELIHFEGIEEGVSNSNFKLDTTTGLYALTLFEAVTPEADLPFFMAYTQYLDQAGYPAPGPVRRKDGEIIGLVNAKPCAIIKWLSGRWPRDPDRHHCVSAGAYLARLHLLGEGFKSVRANSMGMAIWPALVERCSAKSQHAIRAQNILTKLKAVYKDYLIDWPTDLPKGIIHGDYFIDNVLMDEDGQVTGVIDYYYACTDFYAYDLAIALNAWGFTPGGVALPEMSEAFLAGYQSVRALSKAEAKALNRLCVGAAMRFTLTRLYDLLNYDPTWLVKPKDPEAFFRRFEFYLNASA